AIQFGLQHKLNWGSSEFGHVQITIPPLPADSSNWGDLSENRKCSLRRADSPTGGIPHRRKGLAVQWCGAVKAYGLEMVGRTIAFVARQPVFRMDGIPLFHPHVPA